MNDMPNEVNLPPKKSKNKLLIFGGLGCGLLLLLCVGGFGIAFYFGSGMVQDAMQEIASIEGSLKTSEEVIAAVGSPVEVVHGKPVNTTVDGVSYLNFTGTVSGPDGKGDYEAKLVFSGMEGFDLQSLTVDVDGDTIEVNAEDELDLGIISGE